MKKLTLTTICALLAIAVLAQAPQGISHQAVIRDANNQLVTESPIGIQVSIIQGTPEGTVFYSETHTPQSNANGLISFVIGQGTILSGVFASIDWANGPYFIETKADPAGGTNYTITGTSQMFSVPYSLYANKANIAETVVGSVAANIYPATVIATAASNIESFSATMNGIVNAEGFCSTVVFEWGETTSYGNTSNAIQSPVTGSTDVMVSANLTGLMPGSNFFYRIKASNAVNVSYSENMEFITSPADQGEPCPGTPTIMDIDGNIYNTVVIGGQCWMKENLKTTKYRNVTIIDNPTGNSDWQNNTIGAYAWYNNDISWKDSYGSLYNWHAVNNANGLCPTGWHVPTDAEFTAMTNHLGGESVAGGKMKSTRTVPDPHPRWENPNTGATNASNWSGLPGGYRMFDGTFYNVGYGSGWWSSTEGSTSYAWYRFLEHTDGDVDRINYYKTNGFSVRCLRD